MHDSSHISNPILDTVNIVDATDSLPNNAPSGPKYTISDEVLDEIVDYGSDDTTFFLVDKKELHLIGNAYARYEGRELLADYIVIKLDSNIAYAEGYPDSTGELSGFPIFKEVDREFRADKIRFNFESKKGTIYDIRTQEQDIYILGQQTKFISSEASDEGNVVYIKDGQFTTCDHEIPHYSIKTGKIKTVLGRVAVTGPANLQISDVPTPAVLPFGFFPLSNGVSAGLIFPRDYEYSETQGFGLRNIGYYTPINDKMDLTVTGDIYFSGSYGIRPYYRYKKRYKYNGHVSLGWQSLVQEFIGEVQDTIDGVPTSYDDLMRGRNNSFNIEWQHTQDPLAHPSRKIGGNINFQTNNYIRQTYTDARSQAENTVRSRFSFSESFPGKPYSLNVSLSHSQNNNTNEVDIVFPQIDFNLQRIYPFKRKKQIGGKKWYEDVSFQYKGKALNKMTGIDSTLFDDQFWKDARYGVRHDMRSEVNLKIMKNFTLTPYADYDEYWFFHTQKNELLEQLEIRILDTIALEGDTIIVTDTTFGVLDEEVVQGFKPYRDFKTGASLSTQLYSTMQFSKGWLRGVRHQFNPKITFTYSPDQTTGELGYVEEYETDLREEESETRSYNVFRTQGNVFSVSPSGKESSISYSLGNNLEAKYFSKKDSTTKKLKIINNLGFSGSYDMAKDSFRLSPFRGNGTTRLFDGISTIQYNATWDFYALNEDITTSNRRINASYASVKGKPLRFDNASLTFTTRINNRNLKKLFQKNKDSGPEKVSRRDTEDQDDLFSVFKQLSLNHTYKLRWSQRVDTLIRETTTHNINLSVSRVRLSPNWNLTVGNIGYNFVRKTPTYPDFGIFRDLHCWEAGLTWQPQAGTFNFFLRVKPGSFGFINLPYRRSIPDSDLGF